MPTKRLLHLLIALSSMSLSSCIYSDLGRTIGSIGTEVPRLVPAADRGLRVSYCGQLYRKDGRYYVAIPLAWVPERRRGYEHFSPLVPDGVSPFDNGETYNRPYTAEELRQYPATTEYFEARSPEIVPFHVADPHGAIGYLRADLKPASDFNPQGAESLGLHGVAGAAHRIGHLKKHHAWYHYPLLPLQAAATVADVALSVVLMPLSFPVFALEDAGIWEPEWLDTWHDHTILTYGGSRMPEYDTGIDPPETLEGKCLILGDKRFDFPHGNSHRKAAGHKEYSYSYMWWPGGLTPLPMLIVDLDYPGESFRTPYGYWTLFFTTSDSGTAVLLHQRGAEHEKGTTLPFRIEKL